MCQKCYCGVISRLVIGQRSTAPATAISLFMMLNIADTRGKAAPAAMASRCVLFYVLTICLFTNSLVNNPLNYLPFSFFF